MTSSFRRKPKGAAAAKPVARRNVAGQVRIIAGQWRGRKLAVPEVEGLRPTGDRVRETLFNWLRDSVAGARCLDLFAGSGALGFEALSRYAKTVTFVEPEPSAYANLVQTCQLLDVPHVKELGEHAKGGASPSAVLFAGTAQRTLEHWRQADSAPCFDVVFIDPPFQLACQWTVLEKLATVHLADNALVYVESPRNQPLPEQLPKGCEIIREKRSGEVMVRLIRYSCAS